MGPYGLQVLERCARLNDGGGTTRMTFLSVQYDSISAHSLSAVIDPGIKEGFEHVPLALTL
jgi:hypothetical protein